MDLHGFFESSTADYEDSAIMGELNEITLKFGPCHSSVRWLTLKFVLVGGNKKYFSNMLKI